MFQGVTLSFHSSSQQFTFSCGTTFHCTTSRTKLLVLSQADAQHRLEVRDTVTFRLKIPQLIEHKTCLIKPPYPGFHRTLTPVETSGSRLSLHMNIPCARRFEQ